MLDTALIDEEQVPVLENVKKYLKDTGEIIPQGIFNLAQLVNMEREYFHYDDVGENINYEPLSNEILSPDDYHRYHAFDNYEILYSKINFLDDINPKFEGTLDFKIRNGGEVNGVKITTVTKLNENIVCGPTPMLNPPLLIPLDNLNVKRNDLIRLNLKYIMGNGIETIKTEYVR
jgi:predicted RNA methylase